MNENCYQSEITKSIIGGFKIKTKIPLCHFRSWHYIVSNSYVVSDTSKAKHYRTQKLKEIYFLHLCVYVCMYDTTLNANSVHGFN